MRKEWPAVALALLVLTACTTTQEPQNTAPPQPAYNGPVVEIPGVEPKYEPINPGTSQDYSANGKSYRIVKDPSNFSEVGLAAWYGDEAQGKRTATGESYDPDALSAAHPTLPLPSYVRVTNLANGRQIVVRVNDRGPYTPGRIIDLSRAAGDRLNISNNSRVRVDYIKVAPDGTLSGPGTIGTVVAKQSYALPARPDLGGNGVMNGSSEPAAAPVPAQDIRAVDNRTLQSNGEMGAPVSSSGFLGAPQPLANGVLEGSEPAPQPVAAPVAAPAAAPVASSATAQPSGDFVVQVGAINDAARAQQMAQSLGEKYGVPGSVENAGNNVYRIQLGGFKNRADAAALQQRLNANGQASFITSARR
ncbi:MAG: endolytic peptidoglycan transglycosylase RlpA [Pantoea sp.]|uniref:endolytic peptidoglycan transglycosylase RlpA n=1 Tax=Pantoea TaxID=53335 RepID=UPI0028A8BC59|nr:MULTISPECIES: endolytic peptidoglycan transglycosylase RlpA [Pantoea]MDU1573458.1 endolytic peptidoglycan transglycosylase RlpA [Pantoea sp.]